MDSGPCLGDLHYVHGWVWICHSPRPHSCYGFDARTSSPCLGKSLLVIFRVLLVLWEYFHSSLCLVVAAVFKLKACFQLVWDKALSVGCPEQVLPLCPSPGGSSMASGAVQGLSFNFFMELIKIPIRDPLCVENKVLPLPEEGRSD